MSTLRNWIAKYFPSDHQKMSKRQNDKISAFVRVDKSGAAYIPSNEIAALPEVKEMQKMASLIVKQKRTSTRK
ncbi:MAG: hypothetical protein ACL7AX_12600 [Candidatus Arsenophonus phytopathogenicus]